MFKIKLLIFLLINIIIISCVNKIENYSDQKFSLYYIDGEYDGLLFKNFLETKLKSINKIDQNSKNVIKASISHSQKVYITNIDNTSDRELVTTSINIKIYDENNNCLMLNYSDSLSQFYIFSSSDKFLSNKTALDSIKHENTHNIVQNFIERNLRKRLYCEK